MRIRHLIATVVTAASIGCVLVPGTAAAATGETAPSTTTAAPDPALFGTEWVAQAAVDDDVLTVPTRPEASASIRLDGEGGISGGLGCDMFTGPVTATADTITVGKLDMPLIICIIGNSVLAGPLMEVLKGPANYVVRNDLLYLTRAGGPCVILKARESVTDPVSS